MLTLNCAWCGGSFSKRKAEVKRQMKKGRNYFFCSLNCAAHWGNRKKKNKDIKKVCPYCEEEFTSHTGTRAPVFCSRSCASAGSVTEKRLKGNAKGGIKFDIYTIAKGLKKREAWKYKELQAFLNFIDISYEFEYPIENVGIFDLALFSENTLVEYDGPYHRNEQLIEDEHKDEKAKALGWRVVRISVNPSEVISPKTLYSLINKNDYNVYQKKRQN